MMGGGYARKVKQKHSENEDVHSLRVLFGHEVPVRQIHEDKNQASRRKRKMQA